MTLVSNHVPLNTTVISANEYEGHYAFDLLYNNSGDIQPKSLATDNHGTNNVNFAGSGYFRLAVFTPIRQVQACF
ncbi:Tn3 family transposase [Vibrio sp. 10N.286.45.E10]|uniref:Tn3 family transposase n=1 Tax=Vibrio sp. 10N.286.45.E10 TaxID=1884476 RepID=UPI0039A4568F